MRILIISDTHREHNNLREILAKASYDRVFHLGDSEGQEDKIATLCGCPLEIVRGNCDIFSSLPEDIVLKIKNNTILLTHGHRYNVKYDYLNLVLKAKEIEANYVFFGHTHRAEIIESDGIVFANPGSLSYGRGTRGPSYIVADIDSEGEIHLNINYMR